MSDYRGYGKAARAAPADDRHSDDGRHRERGTELRRHLGRGDAHEDGVWRSVRRGKDRASSIPN